MRKITSIILILISSLFSFASPKKEQTPKAITKLIENCDKLMNLSENHRSEAYLIHEDNLKLFAASKNSGINIDTPTKFNSEIYYLGLGPVSKSETYCYMLYSLLFKERSLKIKHEILSNNRINRINNNGKDEIYFYETQIKKTCVYYDSEKIIWQSFEIDPSTDLIDLIKGYDFEPSDWGHKTSTASIPDKPYKHELNDNYSNQKKDDQNELYDQKGKNLSEKELLRLAAKYYTSKDYTKAVETYKTIIEKYPENPEPYLQIGLIIYHKNGWSKKIYSNYKDAAIQYLKQAYDLSTGKLQNDIKKTLHRWEHSNYF